MVAGWWADCDGDNHWLTKHYYYNPYGFRNHIGLLLLLMLLTFIAPKFNLTYASHQKAHVQRQKQI